MPIPYIIHQIWWQGPSTLPSHYQELAQTWRNLEQSGFRYELWDEKRVLQLVGFDSHHRATLENLTTMIEKIDYSKFVILHAFGGLYCDMDSFMFPTKVTQLKQLLDNTDWFFGEHNVSKTTVALNLFVGLKSTNILVNNAIIGSCSNQSILEQILVKIQSNACKNWVRFIPKQYRVLYTTAPNIVTNVIVRGTDWRQHIPNRLVFEPFDKTDLLMVTKKNIMETLTALVEQTPQLKQQTIAIHLGDLNWIENKKTNCLYKLFRLFLRI